MAKKPKKDELSAIGVISAILRNSAQQRSLKRARDRRNARLEARKNPEQRAAEKKARKKAEKQRKKAEAAKRGTRTPEQLEADAATSRVALVDTVDALKYDLDVPARLADARDHVAARVPREWRGEPRASIVAGAVAVVGWGTLVWTAVARSRSVR